MQILQEIYVEEGGDEEKRNILIALPRNLWQKSTFDPFRIKMLPASSPEFWLLNISQLPLARQTNFLPTTLVSAKVQAVAMLPKAILHCSSAP